MASFFFKKKNFLFCKYILYKEIVDCNPNFYLLNLAFSIFGPVPLWKTNNQ